MKECFLLVSTRSIHLPIFDLKHVGPFYKALRFNQWDKSGIVHLHIKITKYQQIFTRSRISIYDSRNIIDKILCFSSRISLYGGFTTLKNVKPSFMHDIFKRKLFIYSPRNPNDLQHHRPNQVTFGSNSLRSLGPQIWNELPIEIKSSENWNGFKHMIKKWDGPNYKCNACQHVTDTQSFLRPSIHTYIHTYNLLMY